MVGATAAWLIALAAGSSFPASEFEAVVLGAWLVTALGAWIKVRLEDGLEARIAVVGPREFAADFVAELEAAGVRAYDVIGWISSEGPAQYRPHALARDARRRSQRGDPRAQIDLIVCGARSRSTPRARGSRATRTR